MASPDARVDAYLAALPDHQRQLLEKLRADVARLVPGAVETISYGMRREARAKHGY